MKNAFEETTMKNVPIDLFWSFKWRNGVQNWNLRKKLSKIGLVRNFDFWSKVNAKSPSQLVQGQSQRILVRVSSRFPGQVTGQAAKTLTSFYDVSLMWTRADVDVLAWLLTWSDDVIRWCQMNSAAVFGAWQECTMFTGAWRRSQKPRWRVEARATAVESHISSVGRLVVDMADRRARVANGWATHEEIVAVGGKDPYTQATRVGACERNRRPDFSGFAYRRAMRPTWRHVWLWSNWISRSLTARGDVLEVLAGRVSAWAFCWGPSFWLFVAGGRGAHLWCWFHQVKQGFA